MQIQTDTEHIVGSSIGAGLAIIKQLFSYKYVAAILLEPHIDLAISAFIGGGVGYIGTTFIKWLHEVATNYFNKKNGPIL